LDNRKRHDEDDEDIKPFSELFVEGRLKKNWRSDSNGRSSSRSASVENLSSSTLSSDDETPLPLPNFSAIVKQGLRDGDSASVWNMVCARICFS